MVQDTFLMYVNTDTGKYHFYIRGFQWSLCSQNFGILMPTISVPAVLESLFCFLVYLYLLLVQTLCFVFDCPHTQTQCHLYAEIECNKKETNNGNWNCFFLKQNIFEPHEILSE